jgi:hypothetical protein
VDYSFKSNSSVNRSIVNRLRSRQAEFWFAKSPFSQCASLMGTVLIHSTRTRLAYQKLGDALRAIHADALTVAWHRDVRTALTSGARVVVPDIRTPEEAALLHALGGELWRVLRPGHHLEGPASQHPTEVACDTLQVNVEVRNDGALEELRASIDARRAGR